MTRMAACCTFLVIASAGPNPELPIFGSFIRGLWQYTLTLYSVISRPLRNPRYTRSEKWDSMAPSTKSAILYPGCIALHMYKDEQQTTEIRTPNINRARTGYLTRDLSYLTHSSLWHIRRKLVLRTKSYRISEIRSPFDNPFTTVCLPVTEAEPHTETRHDDQNQEIATIHMHQQD